MRGLSTWLSFGKYAGFKIEVALSHPATIRIVLGWVAFVIMACDIDRVIGQLVRDANRAKNVE